MRYALRPLLMVIVLIVFAFPVASYAQNNDTTGPVLIQGTPELEKLVAAVRDAYVSANPDEDVEIDPGVGLRGAFEALCRGEVDIVMSTEPIEDSHIAACSQAGQNFIEVVLAYEAVVLLPTPEAELTCVSQDVLFNAWQLGAPADMTWADLGSTVLETPVVFYGPEDLTPAYLLLSNLVPAEDLRDDIVKTDDVANVLSKVQEAESGAFGFMSLADLNRVDAEGTVSPLAIEDADLNCITPSLETLADRSYPLARTNYLYVNVVSATREEVVQFLNFALVDEGGIRAAAPAQGYTAASEDVYGAGADNVTNLNVGRTFTRPETPVSISTGEVGVVSVAGTTTLNDLITPIQGVFTSEYNGAAVEENLMGNTAGWQAFCSGAADVLQATREATDEELALCAENGIEPYTLDYGYEALVVAVPAGNDWIECLDAELAGKLFNAGTEEAPAATKWSDVNPDWPETDILFVLPSFKTGETDQLVLGLIGDLGFPFRVDAQLEKDDPLYRVQGVANTDNGITYGWWSDVQGTEADVKWLAVDAGEGCVAPSPETFVDGTYALAYPVRVYFSQASFENGLVRAFLWSFFSEGAFDALADHPFAGLDLDLLRGALRDEVFQMLADYEAQPVEPEGEPTPEPTVEPTVEPTEEPTVEPTAEPTEEPTVEPTVEPTTEPTEEPTVEPTIEPTATD